jgi:negative regulator of genetic competence, sporulation and motility
MNIEICKKCEKLNNVDAFTFVADLQGELFIPTIMDEDNEPICKMTAMFLRDCNPYNTLYKDDIAELYILAMTQTEHSTSDFNRICNMLSEYGCAEPGDGATLAFLEEHCTAILPKDALQTLGQL